MTNNRYRKLSPITQTKWLPGCPVEIEAGTLLYDSAEKTVVVQLKLRNVSSQALVSVHVHAFCFDEAGDIIPQHEAPVQYAYQDLNANPRETFGDRLAFPVGSASTRNVEIAFCKVAFRDGTIWRNDDDTRGEPLHPQNKIEEYGSDLYAQFNREIDQSGQKFGSTIKLIYVPNQRADAWQCACGFPNLEKAVTCGRCGVSKEWIFHISQREYLESSLIQFTEQQLLIKAETERLEKERRLQQEKLEAEKIALEAQQTTDKQRKRKKAVKIALIAGPICAVMIAAFILNATVIQPRISYNKAMELYNMAQYDDAIEAFMTLNDYRDSKDMILSAKYLSAKVLIDNGKYDEAAAVFSALTGYKDSDVLKQECSYLKASDLLAKKQYDEAAAIFGALGDYKDSTALMQESFYLKASDLLGLEQFDEAAAVFTQLGEYKDSAAQAKQSIYSKAMALFGKRQYKEAAAAFSSLGDYSDSANQIQECNYQLFLMSIAEKQWEEAINLSSVLPGYKDVDEKAIEAFISFIPVLVDREDEVKALEYIKLLEGKGVTSDELSSLTQKCNYQLAIKAYKQDDYIKAGDLFVNLLSYHEDVQDYLYNCAVALFNADKKKEARTYFLKIPTYKDVKTKYLPQSLIVTVDMLQGTWVHEYDANGDMMKRVLVFSGDNLTETLYRNDTVWYEFVYTYKIVSNRNIDADGLFLTITSITSSTISFDTGWTFRRS